MRKTDIEQNYILRRLGRERNDKGSHEKLMDDARLRGSIGTYAANKLIHAIDLYKTGASAFDSQGRLRD